MKKLVRFQHNEPGPRSPGDLSDSRRLAGLPLVVLALVTLACGSFVPRPTPIPRPTITPIVEAAAEGPLATDTPALPTSVPTRVVPTPTFTPTPVPGTVIAVGQSARVVAGQGLNVRKSAGATGDKAGRYAPNAIVSVLEGPVDVDSYRWWRVGNNELSGWVAEGDGTELWLSPDLGGTEPVARTIQVGDTVLVTVGTDGLLKVRSASGLGGKVQHQVKDGVQLKVDEGPVDADGYRWWKLSGVNDVSGWAAEGSGDEKWLKPLE